MINTINLNEVRKQIEQLKQQDKEVIIQGQDIEFNRKVLEMKNINLLVLSHKDKKDKLKQRDSALNHILCRLAKQNNIIFAINFEEILASQKIERAEILARIMQNIKLMKKAKNSVKLIKKSSRNNYDLFSLLLVLGMPTDMAKKAVE